MKMCFYLAQDIPNALFCFVLFKKTKPKKTTKNKPHGYHLLYRGDLLASGLTW